MEKATWLPSGEKAGLNSRAVRPTKGTTSFGGGVSAPFRENLQIPIPESSTNNVAPTDIHRAFGCIESELLRSRLAGTALPFASDTALTLFGNNSEALILRDVCGRDSGSCTRDWRRRPQRKGHHQQCVDN